MNRLFFKMLLPLWLVLIVLNFATPKVVFSENENRELAEFPKFTVKTLLNGGYMQAIDTYVNDHFVGRDGWITAQSSMEYTTGKREVNGVFLCKDALMSDVAEPDEAAVAANLAGMRVFAARYDIPSYLLLVPSAAAVQTQKLPPFAASWNQQAFIEEVNRQAGAFLTPVNLFPTLAAQREEYIYYRTDHHWTTDGAYLAYREASAAMGLPVRPADTFAIRTVSESFVGTLASKTGVRSVLPDQMRAYDTGTVTRFTAYDGKAYTEYPAMYFEEALQKKDKYAYFLGANQPLVQIKTAANTGKKLLLFKDSYAHSFAPFFVSDYDEITLVDMRYINSGLTDLLDPTQYDAVVYLYSTDVFSQQYHVSKLKALA